MPFPFPIPEGLALLYRRKAGEPYFCQVCHQIIYSDKGTMTHGKSHVDGVVYIARYSQTGAKEIKWTAQEIKERQEVRRDSMKKDVYEEGTPFLSENVKWLLLQARRATLATKSKRSSPLPAGFEVRMGGRDLRRSPHHHSIIINHHHSINIPPLCVFYFPLLLSFQATPFCSLHQRAIISTNLQLLLLP